MTSLLVCGAVALGAYLLGYHDGKRRGRNDLDKILGDFGKLAREVGRQLLGKDESI